ncbi:helix-turn-helix transcriptional regulator [Chitinimonas sp. BJB300]|uniref:helix-turn-helix transcriptional regulator n=1 Tax=Chitinimonas sp. BJB300 TaxID=1559339 RepID=UPI000C0EB428|nr:AlpA family transcriptional regulator [Chitinimonas sp. BJB300]PHV09647.1 hypothetical protein CSQ89_20535 [Chitinimonas sp. BJB300]TSJ91515.1 AlpA family transcriptional regulator [Chitinimonas sp. BJB300]
MLRTQAARLAGPAGTSPTNQASERFLRLPEVMSRTALSRSSIYAAIQRGIFPNSISLGGKSVAWLESEITAWQAARIANRNH